MAPMQEEIKTTKASHENIKLMGILNFAGDILGGWGWIAVIVYYAIKKDTYSAKDVRVFNDIINFHLSFFLYFIISFVLMIVLVGFVLIAFFGIAALILLILSTLKYVNGEEYEYPMVITFLK